MKKIIITMLLTIGMVFGTTVLTTAPAHAAVNCEMRQASDSKTVNDGSAGDDEWFLKFSVIYRYCVDTSGPDYVKVQYSVGMYNEEGGGLKCDALTTWNRLHYVSFNPYFWDNKGRNYNPGAFHVPCDQSSIGSKSQFYSEDIPRLFFSDGAPRFKANYKIEKSGVFYEPEGTLSGYLHR